MNDNSFQYPNQNIDPKLKGFKFILQFVKAAYADNRGYIPKTPMNSGQSKMTEIKQYAMGKQPIDKYKKQLLPADQQDNSWMATDWEPLALLCKYREIAISKLVQREYDMQAFAVDALAKSEEDAYFNKMKVKIMMREQAEKMGSELSESPILAPQQGEPDDMDALKMQQEYGYKHIMSMEAEEANQLIQQQNDIAEKRKRAIESLYDFGIGGYTTWIDENGMVKFREINPENLLLSYCSKNDFSDLSHWGEMIEVYVGDLAPYFTDAELNDICINVAGKFGNPSNFAYGADMSKYWSKFKCLVLDFKFKSYNSTVFKEEVDNRGNLRFGKTDFKNGFKKSDSTLKSEYLQPIEPLEDKGESTPKYKSITEESTYKCKWLIQTDYMYDFGLSENMVRKPSSWWNTSLDIQLYAWNFYKMKWGGITERLIPLEDKACLTWFRLQNLTNKLIPYLINIDFNAVEAVNFGKSGGKAKPSEIVDFIFSNFIVPYRSTDLLSRNPNYKPVSIEATGQLAAFGQLYDDLNNTIGMMQQISGLNEVTDGSTPNSKNLNSTNAAAQQSTNNALYLIENSDRWLMKALSDSIISKVQIAVKLGKVEGYRKALGSSTVSFLSINPDIQNYELGIFMEDAPTVAQREQFWMSLTQKEYAGIIEPSDKILIMSCRNLKQADIVLAYRIKKRKEEAQQQKMAEMQAMQQGQTEGAMQIEQMKVQSAAALHQMKMEEINATYEWQYNIEGMKKSADTNAAQIQAEAKVIANQIMGDAKIAASHIASNSAQSTKQLQSQTDLLATHMDNEAKKEISKNKPKTTKTT